MSPWKQLLLECYYDATRPCRAWRRRRAATRGDLPIVALFYHRVADDGATEWTVSNDLFRRQIDWLRKRFEMISLEEVQRRMREGRNTRPAVALTFDDGYAENCRHAIPLLIKHGIPCTYFVTLSNAQHGHPFDHDRNRGFDFPPNSIEQLRAMADAGVEIGAHCRHHDDLALVRDPERLHDEIVTAGRELAERIGRPVRYLAFPFGHYLTLRSDLIELARRAGYLGFCSAYGGYNFPGDDPFHIQRFHVDDDMIRLKNRATIDRRHLRLPGFRIPPSSSIPLTHDDEPCYSNAAH
ncbi:MAG: polysaccharide deacetylase family protein [Pirellulaceae bacterium]|nr:polysaccharide deacetylase family protein [Pirellulaceae bacterium]